MKSSITDALRSALDGYASFFENTSAMGAALFAAALFVVLRGVGMIRDENINTVKNLRLLVATGVCAAIMVACGFIAQNVLLSFSVEILREEPFSGCEFPLDDEPATFFMNCHRGLLLWLVSMVLISGMIAVICMLLWFILQIRRLSDDRKTSASHGDAALSGHADASAGDQQSDAD